LYLTEPPTFVARMNWSPAEEEESSNSRVKKTVRVSFGVANQVRSVAKAGVVWSSIEL